MATPTSEPVRTTQTGPVRRADAVGTTVDGAAGAAAPARRLPLPAEGRWAAEEYVAKHLGHLVERRRAEAENRSSSTARGGQAAADAALRRLVLNDYAEHGRNAYPQPRRTVSHLSPWIRHGLLSLQRVWDSVEGGRPADVEAFRRGLLLQEYGRHLYARLGTRLADLGDLAPAGVGGLEPGVERRATDPDRTDVEGRQRPAAARGWDRRMGCIDLPLDELEEDGWLVAEGRRWLAAWWLRHTEAPWRQGEDHFFRHLLDGSRAVNRVSWLRSQGVLGAGPDPFTRWEVERLAPGLCASCELVYQCPVERLADPIGGPDPTPPSAPTATAAAQEPLATALALLQHDPDPARTSGPLLPSSAGEPEEVWLTAESLGDDDPALRAHPELPVVFVFDEPLLARLRLSSTRLSFLVETLAELATRRRLDLWLGDPLDVLADRRLAATFTPVPGWRRRADRLDVVATHPWPWLRMPISSRIDSYDCWWQAIS